MATIDLLNQAAYNSKSEEDGGDIILSSMTSRTFSDLMNDPRDDYCSMTAKHFTGVHHISRRCSSPGTFSVNRYIQSDTLNKESANPQVDISDSRSKIENSCFFDKIKRRFSSSRAMKNYDKIRRRSTMTKDLIRINLFTECEDSVIVMKNLDECPDMENIELCEENGTNGEDDDGDEDSSMDMEPRIELFSNIKTRRGAVTSKDTTSDYRLYNVVQKSGNRHQVYVCVVFLKIGEIDTIKEQYAADVLIKSKWREPELDNKTDQLDYDWTNSWSPKLYIENTIGEAKEHIYHMITFNEFNHAFLCEKRRVSGIFLENLELNHFPFDVQDLTITVASNLPTSEIRLVNDPDESHRINKQSFVDEQEWYLYKHIETEQKEIAYEYTDPATVRPALSVKCRAARRPAYFIWNIFLVTFLICSLSLVTFAVDKSLPQNRLQLTYTLVLTLVAFKFVVNQCLPKISYLTYLDKYVISSLFILTLICLWHGLIVVIEKISDRFKYKLPEDMEMYVIIVMSLGYLGYNCAFIIMIYCVACKRRRDMKQKDREYVEKVQCQMKYKGMRAKKMVQQTHQLHEVKENGNATFI